MKQNEKTIKVAVKDLKIGMMVKTWAGDQPFMGFKPYSGPIEGILGIAIFGRFPSSYFGHSEAEVIQQEEKVLQ